VEFEEKPEGGEGWINGGYFVLSPKVIEYIADYAEMWEHGPMKRIIRENQLSVFQHSGFWQSMDTLRDKNKLEELWNSNQAPWKIWD
jgi:glucose-1-phosphate cytidylyltransferase